MTDTATKTVEEQLAEMNDKLSFITEEIEAMRRQRQSMEELQRDLSVVGKDIYNTAIVELEEVSPFVKTEHFFNLGKRILRNISSLADAFSKFESVLDLYDDFTPIGKDIFNVVLYKLDELDRKGYFEFATTLNEILDDVIANTSPDDLRKIRDNVVLPAIELMKSLADSDVVPALNRTIEKLKDTDPENFEMSLFSILKGMNSKEVRPLLGMGTMFLQALARESNTTDSERR